MQTKSIDNLEVSFVSWPTFISRSRKDFRFIRFEAPDILRVNRELVQAGEHYEFFYHLKVHDVDVDNLKFLGVWDKLSKDLQERLIKGDIEQEVAVNEHMEHMRKHRRNKYPNVPHEVTCKNCGVVQKMAPGMIVARAEKIAKEKKIIFTAEDYIKAFVCQKCHSTKGRKPTNNLPPKVELKCKCGKTILYPAAVALKFASKKGLTVEKYISTYQCQTCNPTKWRKKGQKRGKK
jgi:hypothetical protein